MDFEKLGHLDGCAGCRQRPDHAFCSLPSLALKKLDEISYAVTYPQRVTLFSQDQPCRGVFILCEGKAKVTATRAGKPLMLRVAMAGDALGVSAAMSGRNYELTAETLARSTVRFVKREDFLQLLLESSEVMSNVIQGLSLEYEHVVESLRNLGLRNTATARVAQLLLNICAQEASARFLFTQEQIAQMTATTRETVTRLMGQLRKEKVISIRGSSLTIRDRTALERMAC